MGDAPGHQACLAGTRSHAVLQVLPGEPDSRASACAGPASPHAPSSHAWRGASPSCRNRLAAKAAPVCRPTGLRWLPHPSRQAAMRGLTLMSALQECSASFSCPQPAPRLTSLPCGEPSTLDPREAPSTRERRQWRVVLHQECGDAEAREAAPPWRCHAPGPSVGSSHWPRAGSGRPPALAAASATSPLSPAVPGRRTLPPRQSSRHPLPQGEQPGRALCKCAALLPTSRCAWAWVLATATHQTNQGLLGGSRTTGGSHDLRFCTGSWPAVPPADAFRGTSANPSCC